MAQQGRSGRLAPVIDIDAARRRRGAKVLRGANRRVDPGKRAVRLTVLPAFPVPAGDADRLVYLPDGDVVATGPDRKRTWDAKLRVIPARLKARRLFSGYRSSGQMPMPEEPAKKKPYRSRPQPKAV